MRPVAKPLIDAAGKFLPVIDFPDAIHPTLMLYAEFFADRTIAARPRDQLIERDDDPYIERWYLARKAQVPGNSPRGHFDDHVPLIPSELENLYLHRYTRADAEEPHCHPWPNATLVVTGWYDEAIFAGNVQIDVRRRHPGDVVLRQADAIHAIVGCRPGTITLFSTLKKERDWGFYTSGGFIPWQNFRAWKREQEAA